MKNGEVIYDFWLRRTNRHVKRCQEKDRMKKVFPEKGVIEERSAYGRLVRQTWLNLPPAVPPTLGEHPDSANAPLFL